MKSAVYRTPLQNFYAKQSIFITGSTGFLGKVLIEKLLRSCPDISTIYLLIRTKKDKCPETRLDEIFQIPLYNLLKKEMPDFRKKIVLIVGDLNIENFGLSEADKNILINKVSIIFHVAANVRFNESIKVSAIINVTSVDTILKIAKCMPNLKSLIHVSTAYANCYVKYVEERFYTYPINYKELNTLIHTLPENVFEKKIAKIISQWPNTYTFTKAIAEGLIRDESEDLPIGIFRPSIVLSSANEPFGGWIDNTYGPIGILLSSLLGIATFLYSFKHVRADVVPVDFTVNALIVSAYDVFNQHRRGKDMLIYNFVSPVDGPTWNNYKNKLFVVNKIYPLHSAKWFPRGLIIQNKVLYNICIFFGHFLPALFIDAATICIKRKPNMLKIYKKFHHATNAVEYFCTNEWNYSTNNVKTMWDNLNEKDQLLFKFNMEKFNWSKYLTEQYMGLRRYILKEDDNTITISRIKYKRFYWLHQMMKTVFVLIFFYIIWIIYTKIFI